MPRSIFDDDEPLLDYDSVDELSTFGLGDRGYANVYPPEGSNEIFGDQFERRAREMNRTPSGTQPVQIILPRTGPWTANNQLGAQVDFIPSTVTTQRNTEQTMLKLDEWGFPEVWSLMLGMTFSDDKWGTGPSAGFNIVGKIRAGVGGVTQELEVDWVAGTTLSLCMNALNVIGEFAASLNTPTDLRLQLSLAKGKIQGRPPQRSFQISTLTTGGGTINSDVLRIPPFTRSLMVVDRGNPAAADSVYSANFLVKFHGNPNSTAAVVGTVPGNVILNFGSNGFPIPPFARYVSFQASNPAANISPAVIFFLAL